MSKSHFPLCLPRPRSKYVGVGGVFDAGEVTRLALEFNLLYRLSPFGEVERSDCREAWGLNRKVSRCVQWDVEDGIMVLYSEAGDLMGIVILIFLANLR